MKKKALIADNDIFFVRFLAELLEGQGYQVEKAYDGKEAIEKLSRGPFNIIFVDLIMPKIGGKEVIRFIRRRQYPETDVPEGVEAQPHRPVIVLVSSTLYEQMDNLGSYEADYYLAKGPTQEMTENVLTVLNRVEEDSKDSKEEADYLSLQKLFPREATLDLLGEVTYLSSIIEGMPVGLLALDHDAKILKANKAALELLCQKLEEILDRHIFTVLPRECIPWVKEAMRTTVKQRELPYIYVEPPALDLPFKILISLYHNEGRVAGWLVCLVPVEPDIGVQGKEED